MIFFKEDCETSTSFTSCTDMVPVQLGPPTARILMLLKFRKDFSKDVVEQKILHPFSFLTERFGDLYSSTDCKSLQRQMFLGLTVMRLPGRLLGTAFTLFSLWSHRCSHTKFLSRCVLNRSTLIAFKYFFQRMQHDPFQTKQTNRPTTPKQPKVTGIAKTQEHLSSQAHFLISFPILHGQVAKDES